MKSELRNNSGIPKKIDDEKNQNFFFIVIMYNLSLFYFSFLFIIILPCPLRLLHSEEAN